MAPKGRNILTQGFPTPPGEYPPPQITGIDRTPAGFQRSNAITIHWTSSRGYDQFRVRWSLNIDKSPTLQFDVGGGQTGSFAVPTAARFPYNIAVAGGTSAGIIGGYNFHDFCSPVLVTAIDDVRTQSLREFLQLGGIDPSGQRLRTLAAAGESLRRFLGLPNPAFFP